MKRFLNIQGLSPNIVKGLFYIILFVIPVLIIFRTIFFGGLLAGGDAPFFYKQGLKELVTEPQGWTQREVNFGGVNTLLWLSPLTFLYGVLGSFLNMGNGLAVRVVFYLPTILLSVAGFCFFARYLKFSGVTVFFGSLFYVINTYLILLVDGGQVGVALSYGIFPFTVLFLKKLFDTPKIGIFFIALAVLFLETVADPRVALISLLTIFIWVIIESLINKDYKKLGKIAWYLPLVLILSGLNLFWIYPLLKNGSENGFASQSVNFTSLLSSLFVFQPNFPGNQFGKINPPPFYFALLPILIFLNFFYKERKKMLTTFLCLILLFIFLAKGGNPPFGAWYDLMVSKIPFGSSFRDSSKFFIPLILYGALLIGNSIEFIYKNISKVLLKRLFLFAVYLYVLFLVFPALAGKLNFVLSRRITNTDSNKIYENINGKPGFFRTAWFSEVEPTSFESFEKPSIDGKDLVGTFPFRSMNASEDVFNFVNNPNFVDWFRVLSIKYLFLSGNPRDLTPSPEDQKNWESTKEIIEKHKGLTKLNWGTTYPAYEIDNISSHAYVVDSLVGVVGPMSEDKKIQLMPSVYFEDEKFDPKLLQDKSPDSLKIFFNNKEQIDLTMSFLKKFFKSTNQAPHNQWATYSTDKYLKAKYELLIRGVTLKDLDYGKGMSMSTQSDESLVVPLVASASADYVYVVRSMSATSSANLKITLDGDSQNIKSKKLDFGWHIFGPFKLDEGLHNMTIQNKGGLQVVNVVALIPNSDFSEATKLSKTFIEHFGVVTKEKITTNIQRPVELFGKNNFNYKFDVPSKGYWLVLTDRYSPYWKLRKGMQYFESIPVYAMINGFYLEPNWSDVGIQFLGQDTVRWGVYASVCLILLTLLVYLWLIPEKNERKY